MYNSQNMKEMGGGGGRSLAVFLRNGGAAMSGAMFGRDALRRVRIGSAALVAAAICVATAPSPSWAADWTGLGDDDRMSTPANWLNEQVPAARDDIDFSGVSSDITVNADIDAAFGNVVMGDVAITFTGSLTAASFSDLSKVVVAADSTVTIDGDLETTTQYVVQSIATGGRFIVTGDLTVKNPLNGLANSGAGSFIVRGVLKTPSTSSTAKFLAKPAIVMFGRLEAGTGGRTIINASTVVVGAGGLDTIDNSASPQFRSTPTLYALDGEYAFNGTSDTKEFHLYDATPTLNTTQYGTENVAATVTVNAAITRYSSGHNGGINVTGCGRVVFNSVSKFTKGLAVSDKATVAVNPGMRPGNGTVTVHDGATLEVAQSGEVALVGDLTLADGANLGFNFTDKNTKPVLDVTGKTVTLGENGTVAVKVSAADGIRPKGGSYALTSGGKFTNANISLASGAPDWVKGVSVADGEIVLDVKSRGFKLIVK